MPALGQGWASGEAKGGDGALSLEASELGKVLQERRGGEGEGRKGPRQQPQVVKGLVINQRRGRTVWAGKASRRK